MFKSLALNTTSINDSFPGKLKPWYYDVNGTLLMGPGSIGSMIFIQDLSQGGFPEKTS
jgi:hypothetical protein